MENEKELEIDILEDFSYIRYNNKRIESLLDLFSDLPLEVLECEVGGAFTILKHKEELGRNKEFKKILKEKILERLENLHDDFGTIINKIKLI